MTNSLSLSLSTLLSLARGLAAVASQLLCAAARNTDALRAEQPCRGRGYAMCSRTRLFPSKLLCLASPPSKQLRRRRGTGSAGMSRAAQPCCDRGSTTCSHTRARPWAWRCHALCNQPNRARRALSPGRSARVRSRACVRHSRRVALHSRRTHTARTRMGASTSRLGCHCGISPSTSPTL